MCVCFFLAQNKGHDNEDQRLPGLLNGGVPVEALPGFMRLSEGTLSLPPSPRSRHNELHPTKMATFDGRRPSRLPNRLLSLAFLKSCRRRRRLFHAAADGYIHMMMIMIMSNII